MGCQIEIPGTVESQATGSAAFEISKLSAVISGNEEVAIDYLEESVKWLKGINVDKPCPEKHSSF